MRRTIYNQLLEWKRSERRKPLIVYGARQVGKTFILKEFGKNEYDNLVYVDCYKNDTVASLFSGDADARRILIGLSAFSGQKITPHKTLVFLDEIQEIPHVISTLKYFCEDLPDIHIAVAGSLLGVMNMKGESFPVGKVNIMHLHPMTFAEFAVAMGMGELSEMFMRGDYTLAEAFKDKLKELLRQYYFVGGMPEAVLYFSKTADPIGVRQIQQEILLAYETDISKHTGSETQRIRMVWNSIPAQLARENKKFIYNAIKKGGRAKEFEIAIQWLIDAGLIYKVERTKSAALPLRFYAEASTFKLYLLDVGLLGAMSNAPARQVLIGENIFSEYKGSFTENYVLQQMKTLKDADIYYYSKENSSLEIDFLVQKEATVWPIEVKAEENVKSKSLHAFIANEFKEANLHGIRFSMKGFAEQDWMRNVPLYMAYWYMKNV